MLNYFLSNKYLIIRATKTVSDQINFQKIYFMKRVTSQSKFVSLWWNWKSPGAICKDEIRSVKWINVAFSYTTNGSCKKVCQIFVTGILISINGKTCMKIVNEIKNILWRLLIVCAWRIAVSVPASLNKHRDHKTLVVNMEAQSIWYIGIGQ